VLRAEACEPDFESESVLIAGRANGARDDYDASTPAWAQEVIEQCAAFPNAAHDDLVDMVTMALNWVRTKGVGTTFVAGPEAARLPEMPNVPGGGRQTSGARIPGLRGGR